MQFLAKFEPYAYALLRIVSGFMLLWHGCQKLFGFPAPAGNLPAFIMYIAGPIELIGGILILIGLFTRPAAFIASGMCAVAYFMVHAPRGFFPLLNGGELAALYCFVFLFISTRGAGIWSIDGARRAR
jgi:putative oxidoreductase